MTYPVEALSISNDILEALARGERVTLTRDNGEPIADLVPHKACSELKHPSRKFGALIKGHKVVIDPDWDRPFGLNLIEAR